MDGLAYAGSSPLELVLTSDHLHHAVACGYLDPVECY
jgi:hypothetical protein